MWPEKATAIVAAGRSLQELTGIGPSLAKRLHGWIVLPDLRSARLPFIRSRMMSRNSHRIEEDDQGGAACDKASSDFLGPPI
jgi:hypothetical protein